MADDFYNQLNNWADELEGIADLSIVERLEITDAGAKAFKKGLTEITRDKHFRANEAIIKNKKGEVIGHLADSVLTSKKNVDGIKNGNSIVGFNKQHARIARLLNNGWHYRSKNKLKTKPGDSFIDNARTSLNEQIAAAEFAKAKEIINKKAGI